VKLLSVQAAEFPLVRALDLDLNVDGLVAVVGDNGAGKSTVFARRSNGVVYGGCCAGAARCLPA